MAGTTPIYGLPYPQSSDLVSAYPALGQDLAEDLDGILANKLDVSSYVQPGLTLITSGSVTAANSLTINGYATTTYQHYRVVIDATGSANGQTFGVRLRTAGGVDAATNYVSGTSYFDPGSTATTVGRTSSTTQFDLGYITNGTNPQCGYAFDLIRPNVAVQTTFSGLVTSQNSGTGNIFGMCGGWNTNATAYNSLTIVSSAAWTGTARIYGYRN